MESTRDLSVGELLEQLLADSLIDACQISGDSLTIVQGTKRHSFPYRQARTFLAGMLRGRSWNLKPNDEVAGGVADLPEGRESPRLEVAEPDPTEPDLPEIDSIVLESSTPPDAHSLEPALEALLSMAKEMALIKGWERDSTQRSVTIILSACRTQLHFDEAVLFLSECILYKLNTLREEVGQLLESAGKEGTEPRPQPKGPSGTASRRSTSSGEPSWERLG